MKILLGLGRLPLKINIEILKYLQPFVFIQKDKCVFKDFQEENLAIV